MNDARWACTLLFDLRMLVAPHELSVCCVALEHTEFDCACKPVYNSMAFLHWMQCARSCADHCLALQLQVPSGRSATVDATCMLASCLQMAQVGTLMDCSEAYIQTAAVALPVTTLVL